MNAGAMSEWAHTRTFYPLFERFLTVEGGGPMRVLLVGASDGKFVEPLLAQGHYVIAIDNDTEALGRLADTQPSDRLEIIAADILDLDVIPKADACWTSCSWHYSRNFSRPLSDFISAMADSLADGGWFGAEYMMPVALPHVKAEHYLEPGEIWRYLPGYNNLWEAYTPTFIEMPHPGQAEEHVHRMGFVVARKPGS